MQKCLVVLAVTLCVVACKNQQAAGTSTDGEVVASSDATVGTALRDEIAQVHKQIGETEQESSRYSGGLVKALIESRLQTLKQTLAMLEQRNKAWTFGLRLRYTIDGKLFQLPPGARQQLPQIEQELRDEAAKIRAQEQESAQYSGGLVQALSLSTLATMKQTQAMLDQKRLAIQYELPQYVAFQDTANATSNPSNNTPSSAVAVQAAEADNDWEIVSVASRPGESNDVWTRFAWKLTLRNKSLAPQKYEATIEFRDSDGFPVDSANAYGLVVPAMSEETFTGEKLITASEVAKISSTAAKVKKAT